MNHIMAVYDDEENYAVKLVDYLNLKEGFPFEVINFKDIEKMKEFSIRQKPDIVLVSEGDISNILEFVPEDKLILLSKTGIQYETARKSIYKYQSCENIIREILTMMAEKNTGNKFVMRKSSLNIIGFYSPVKRIRQTTSSLIMGELLARKKRTLYLNMEGFSGLNTILNKPFNKDLSDLIYHIQNGKKGIQYLLGCMVEERNGLAILPPMMCQADLISITAEEWIQLFQELERYSDYEYLILDLSDSVQGIFEILRQCALIYTIVKEDDYAKAKMQQYEQVLHMCNYEDVLDKTKKCQLPIKEKKYSEVTFLLEKDLEDYYKKLVQEDFYD